MAPAFTSHDTRADSYHLISEGSKRNQRQQLHDSMVQAQQAGYPDMSARELGQWHYRLGRGTLPPNVLSRAVNELVKLGLFERCESRQCSLPPHRLISPVRCKSSQALLISEGASAP